MSKLKNIFTTQIKSIYLLSTILVILVLVYVFADINKYVPTFFSSAPSKPILQSARPEASLATLASATVPVSSPSGTAGTSAASSNGDWNLYAWSSDDYTEIRVLKPSTIDDLQQFGIDVEVNDKEHYARYGMAEEIMTTRAVPFADLKNASIRKTLMDKAAVLFDAQAEESRKMEADGITKDPTVMHEFGEVYHVPLTVIKETRDSFDKAPQNFISFSEVALSDGVKAIIGRVVIEFSGNDYRGEEETHTRESTFLFLSKNDRTIAVQEFERSNRYAFFRNKQGLVYFLVNQYGYEGGGLESYLVDQNGLKLVASAGSGV